MSIVKLCGLETEYGLVSTNPEQLTQVEAALALIARCPITPRVTWEMTDEMPSQDARYAARERPATSTSLSAADHAGYLLGNSARLYIDHGHPEYSTPECDQARTLVAHDKAGERLLDLCRKQVNRFLPVGQAVELFKNNSDGQGHSYGCHENYLLTAALYRALFRDRTTLLYAQLIPFLVSRQVICGAGKVGSEHGQPAVDFQIAQRADFTETLLGLQTMSRRPIVNTRDEPHADPSNFRRLHIIAGDANMAEYSTYLKVGITQLFLAMLETGEAMEDLTLADPVAAIVQISHDPTCRQRVGLADGRHMTAVEIQFAFVDAARRYLDRSTDQQAFAPILDEWGNVLRLLADDPHQLGHKLDWVIKWNLLEDWRQRKGLQWSAPELKEIDIRYHDVNPERSIYQRLIRHGRITQLVEEDEILQAMTTPPPATRAQARAHLLHQLGSQAFSANWSRVRQRTSDGQIIDHRFLDPAPAESTLKRSA